MTTEQSELTKINDRTVKQEDLLRLPGMTGWFQPSLLAKLLGRVIVSDLFGQYADRRLIHAALDKADQSTLLRRADLTNEIKPSLGEIWINWPDLAFFWTKRCERMTWERSFGGAEEEVQH